MFVSGVQGGYQAIERRNIQEDGTAAGTRSSSGSPKTTRTAKTKTTAKTAKLKVTSGIGQNTGVEGLKNDNGDKEEAPRFIFVGASEMRKDGQAAGY